MRPTESTPFPDRFGMGNSAAKLRSERRQHSFIGIIETTRVTLTDQQHAEHFLPVHHRHTKNAPELWLSSLRQEIMVPFGR